MKYISLIQNAALYRAGVTLLILLEVLQMNITKFIEKLKHSIAPPCAECPYTLGQVRFVDNPCFDCKSDKYRMYHILKEGMDRGRIIVKD
jgi:hypothetical protein